MKTILKLMIMAFSIFAFTSVHAGTVTVNEDELREFVKTVIKENPKLIYDTVDEYIKELQREKIKEASKPPKGEVLEKMLRERVNDRVNSYNPVKGPADAPVTLIEYTDFQCPFCVRGSEIVEILMQMYPGKIKLVFKNNPLKSHKQAAAAAKAALAAHSQGKFWEYHDLLFNASPELNEELFLKCARDLELDIEKFNRHRNSEEIAKQLESDIKDADDIKIDGTPEFTLNGVLINGAMPPEFFVPIIERLLEEGKPANKPEAESHVD